MQRLLRRRIVVRGPFCAVDMELSFLGAGFVIGQHATALQAMAFPATGQPNA